MTLVWLLCVSLVLVGMAAVGSNGLRAAFDAQRLRLFGVRVRAPRAGRLPTEARPATSPSPQDFLPPPRVRTRPRQ